jgi:hypothetical protein
MRPRNHLRPPPALLISAVSLALASAACDTSYSERHGWAGAVDTLPSGRIVVHNPPEAQTTWTLQERFRLGSLDGTGPDVFGRISGLALGPEGQVYVLDGQASEVRIFGSDGAFQRTFGRSGEGPGELRAPGGLTVDAEGTLWVLNWGNGRYSGFDPETGDVRREVLRMASYAVLPWPGAFENGTHLMDVGLGRTGEPALLRLDTAFVPRDTLALPGPSDEDQIAFRREGRMVASIMVPFAPQPAWAPRPRGGIVVGEGDDYRLHRIDFSGDTSLTIELDREPVRVTGAERDSAIAAFEQRAASLGGATPDRRPNIRDVKPSHGTLLVDDRDHTWVRSLSPMGGPDTWDVFDAFGRFLARAIMPDPPTFLRPVARGNRMAVATQVNGFPQVVIYDLERSSP